MASMIWILTAITLSTRFYNLSFPAYVCWDETHFGKMASHYLNHTYFMDVHPPLGKMLIALGGYISGYDGTFEFKNPGDEYLTTDKNFTQYYGMRAFSAVLGSLTIPLVYGTVESITSSKEAALLSSVLLILDPGLISLSQYILLDPILIFFMASSVFFTVKYSSSNNWIYVSKKRSERFPRPFSFYWWFYLSISGVSLGCMLSVKWIGLFTVCFVGIWTINSLWNLLGDTKNVTMISFIKHFISRAICLIAIPLCIYMASFAVHYKLLDHSGSGDGFHSSMFQSCLKGNELNNASMPRYVAYDSIVTLKHNRHTAGGYLHSHRDLYPIEVMPFQHQQVTLYYHKDTNNYWEILKPSKQELEKAAEKLSIEVPEQKTDGNVQYLRDGDVVRLRHFTTAHNLHSHHRAAPLTHRQQIVSGQQYSGEESKFNELWKVEITDSALSENKDPPTQVEILTTVLRFVHVNTGCLLHSTLKTLPQWASKQVEVTCSHHHKDRDGARWNIEHNSHELLEKTPLESCQMSFFQRLLESHFIMASSNSGLKPQEGERTSQAWHWPLNYKGQAFTRMDENSLRVYLLGNPVIFWLNLLVLILFPIVGISLRAIEQRRLSALVLSHSLIEDVKRAPLKAVLRLSKHISSAKAKEPKFKTDMRTIKTITKNCNACVWFYMGWALHYLPFFLMSRVLYFHHYYPAFIFSSCLTGAFLDLLFKSTSSLIAQLTGRNKDSPLSRRVNNVLDCLFIICILQSFYLFSPLCYGMTGPHAHHKESTMHGLKLLKHWEI